MQYQDAIKTMPLAQKQQIMFSGVCSGCAGHCSPDKYRIISDIFFSGQKPYCPIKRRVIDFPENQPVIPPVSSRPRTISQWDVLLDQAAALSPVCKSLVAQCRDLHDHPPAVRVHSCADRQLFRQRQLDKARAHIARFRPA
jgi:hypothetical protein